VEKHSIEIGTKYLILPNIDLVQFPLEALQGSFNWKKKKKTNFKVHRKFKCLKTEKKGKLLCLFVF